MEEGKDRIISVAGTAVFHLLIILFLLLIYLTPSISLQKPEDFGGVPVMFGNVPDAFGNNEPRGRGDGSPGVNVTQGASVAKEPAVVKGAQPQKTTLSNNQTMTQNLEESVAIKAKNDEKARQEAEAASERRRQEAEANRIAQQQAQTKAQVGNNMSGLFGNGDGDGSRGNTSGTGTQGVPTGNASFGATSGVGGWGAFNLGGRSLGRGGLIKPKYTANDYGTVVVDIVVDSKGNVVEATIGKGTNATSAALKSEALRASRSTKFNAVSSVSNQKGTITYKFNLN